MSYTLAYTGTQIDNILGRSAPNGEFDGYFADINDKLDKLNIVTTSDDYATVQAYVQNNVAVALSDGGKFYVYTGEYDGNYYFACVTQGSSDTTDAVFEVAYIDSGNNWSVGGWSSLAPVFSPNFTGNPTAPTPIQSSNNTKIATTAFVHTAVDPVSNAALNAYPTDTASGDVVSITDGASNIPVKAFTGSIIPQQNLNGQSAPYPAGGGANKVDQSTLTNTGVVSDTGATGTQTTRLFSALFPVTPNTTYYAGVDGKSSNNETIQFNRFIFFDSSKTFLSRSATGQSTTGVNITTPANAYYASIDLRTPALTTNLVAANVTKLWFAVGSGTVAYSPYSNICHIIGWTGAQIIRAGAALDSDIEQGGINSNGINVVADNRIRLKSYHPVDDTKTYCISVESTQGADLEFSISFYDVADYTTYRTSGTSWLKAPYYFTPPSGTKYIRSLIRKANNGVISPSQVANYLLGEAVITLDFGQTVYAGTLTALGGGLWKIQPTHAIVDLWDYEYTLNANFGFRATVTGGITPVAGGDAGSICSAYRRISFPTVADPSLMTDGDYTIAEANISPVINYVYFKNSAYSTAAAFKTAMAGQKLVYTLAPASRPDPITITGEDLQTLLGANTVWTDVGAITGMTYRADTTLYIDKKLGA